MTELRGRAPSKDEELRFETRFADKPLSMVLCEMCGRTVWLADRPTTERVEMFGLEAPVETLFTLAAFSVVLFEMRGRKTCLAGGALVEIGFIAAPPISLTGTVCAAAMPGVSDDVTNKAAKTVALMNASPLFVAVRRGVNTELKTLMSTAGTSRRSDLDEWDDGFADLHQRTGRAPAERITPEAARLRQSFGHARWRARSMDRSCRIACHRDAHSRTLLIAQVIAPGTS